jgi:hypothetical protein
MGKPPETKVVRLGMLKFGPKFDEVDGASQGIEVP